MERGEQPEERLATGWAVVPVVSLGILSWAPFLYASVRTHARKFVLATALYLSLAVVACVILAIAGDKGHSTLSAVGGFFLIVLAAAGCVHTLSIRAEYGRQLALANDPRLLVAEQREELRGRALAIARDNPQRALALGVGRPDVPGSFDAGLVDVNHAGAEALATLPGIDATAAQRIVELRNSSGGFSSLEDLDLALDLDTGTLAELRRRIVFLPRG